MESSRISRLEPVALGNGTPDAIRADWPTDLTAWSRIKILAYVPALDRAFHERAKRFVDMGVGHLEHLLVVANQENGCSSRRSRPSMKTCTACGCTEACNKPAALSFMRPGISEQDQLSQLGSPQLSNYGTGVPRSEIGCSITISRALPTKRVSISR
jgi:hypothetical protein